ncbi:hypothetical protein ABIA22_003206 [Sinorhizobium fredii]|uniref:hypothetical protein n=1 Tax=Rhizobium fredii TaxID=380 RepID=UPI00351910EA
MALAVREQEFAAATAGSFPKSYVRGDLHSPSSSSRTGAEMPIVERDYGFIISEGMALTASKWQHGIHVSRKAYGIAGAVVAASLASLSPVAYAAETLPNILIIDPQCVVDQSEVGSQLRRALDRLRHLSGKGDGWKGPGSVSMSEEVRASAESFLRTYFSEQEMMEPRIGLDSDGDITLFWKNAALIMDLSITPEGTYSFYADVAGDKAYQADENAVTKSLPVEVLTALKADTA